MKGVEHIIVSGRKVSKPQIVANGAAQQRVALRHIYKVAARERRQLVAFASSVVYHGTPRVRAYQGKNHAHKSGLAGAGLAEHGSTAARSEVERKVIHYLAFAVGIGISYILEAHAHPTVGSYMQRSALFLKRIFLKFHEPFCRREHRHKLRNKLCQIACRPLYARHELQKGRHAAERQRVAVHPYGSPQKGDKIACRKAEVEDKARKQREGRAPYHIMPQFALRCLKPLHHGVILFKGLYEHAVLYGFLQHALHAAVAVANVARKTAHAPHI